MMKKIFNKKMVGIGTLAVILLLAVIVPITPIATAEHNDNHNPGGGGGGAGGDGGGAKADIFNCDGTFYQGNWEEVRVKDGKTCTIYALDGDVTITGNVKVGQDSIFQIGTVFGETFTVNVGGDIVSDGGHKIRIDGMAGNLVNIGGSVQIKNTSNGIVVNYANIGGSSQFIKNQSYYSVVNSIVNGNVQIADNSSTSPVGLFNNIAGNTISGNLQCSGNDPAPVSSVFGPNAVTGQKLGQCAGL